MRYLFIAMLLLSCGRMRIDDSKHTVSGETVHRVLIGIDVAGMEATFENRCKVLCKESGTPGQECVDACVAEKADEFIDALTSLYEQIQAQQGGGAE